MSEEIIYCEIDKLCKNSVRYAPVEYAGDKTRPFSSIYINRSSMADPANPPANINITVDLGD